MSAKLGVTIDPAVLTLKLLKEHQLSQGKALEAIRGVSEVAFKENSLKVSMDAVEKELHEISFTADMYKDKKVRTIIEPEKVVQQFEDLLLKIQSLKANQYAAQHADRLERAEKELFFLQSNFESWLEIQRGWMYLEPIYSQEEVTRDLPDQKRVFEDFCYVFKRIMNVQLSSERVNTVADFCRTDGFVSNVRRMKDDIRFLDKSLSDYLDKKRSEFARLYFTSNDELIQLMGNLKNVAYLQVFLGKLFEGIGGLVFEGDNIKAFKSKSGELVEFIKKISTSVPPEMWLREVENGMRIALYEAISRTVARGYLVDGQSEEDIEDKLLRLVKE